MPRIAEHSQHRDFKKARRTPEIDQLRSDIAKHLANKLAKKLNVSSVKVPWSKMKAGDVINWPLDLDFSPISNMSINEVGRLHKLTKDGKLDFTPEFLGWLKFGRLNRANNRDQLRSDVANYLANKLAKELNVSSVKVPWSKMKAGDIINWPSDVGIKSVYHMSINEVRRLHKLTKDGKLDFSPKFLGRFEIRQVNKWYHNQVDQLRSEVSRYLADKLAKKLNVSNIRVPWSEMTEKDIINWPADVDFIVVSKMNVNELKKVHKLTKDGLLDFTPEFWGRVQFGRLQGNRKISWR
jgi:DNA primase catalytic subunit